MSWWCHADSADVFVVIEREVNGRSALGVESANIIRIYWIASTDIFVLGDVVHSVEIMLHNDEFLLRWDGYITVDFYCVVANELLEGFFKIHGCLSFLWFAKLRLLYICRTIIHY